jgi:hypothetical protein
MINLKKEPLTVEKLRELTGENYLDEEAEEILHSVKQLSSILVEYVLEQGKKDPK